MWTRRARAHVSEARFGDGIPLAVTTARRPRPRGRRVASRASRCPKPLARSSETRPVRRRSPTSTDRRGRRARSSGQRRRRTARRKASRSRRGAQCFVGGVGGAPGAREEAVTALVRNHCSPQPKIATPHAERRSSTRSCRDRSLPAGRWDAATRSPRRSGGAGGAAAARRRRRRWRRCRRPPTAVAPSDDVGVSLSEVGVDGV